MKYRLLLAFLCSLSVFLHSSSAFSQVQSGDPASATGVPDLQNQTRVIARVNGHEITAREVSLAADDILPQLPDVPAQLRYPFVVEYLIERHLLAQVAVKDNVAETDDYKARLAFYQAKALRDSYFNTKLKPLVTETEIRAAYDREAAKVKPEMRARARHILVASEKEAKAIAVRLKKGEKFEEIARQVNLDASRAYGGDVGYFSASEMAPEFSKAAFALKVGQVSKPIKTNYGWHLIKVEDFKKGSPQPYDQVKGAIRLVLLRLKVQDELTKLRGQAKIDVLDEDLKKLQAQAEKKREEVRKRLEQQKNQEKPQE